MSAAAVGEATVERVMLAIEREADMDGVATPTAKRIGEIVGISTPAALWAIHRLADCGRLRISGRTTAGRGGVLVLELDGSTS